MHNEVSANSQFLTFESRRCDIYDRKDRRVLNTGIRRQLGQDVQGNMKRGIIILLSVCTLLVGGYFTASKWAIRHETLTFHDPARDNRLVAVDIAVRRDKEMQANAGMIKLPVAVLNHGNTVKNPESSFIANFFAARGYLAISPQPDLPTDPPMVTKVGEIYVGRLPQIERGVANIRFAMD